MKNVIVGGQYMLGALIVGTLWSLVAYGIIEASVERMVEKVAVEQDEFDSLVRKMGEGPNG